MLIGKYSRVRHATLGCESGITWMPDKSNSIHFQRRSLSGSLSLSLENLPFLDLINNTLIKTDSLASNRARHFGSIPYIPLPKLLLIAEEA